MEVLRPRALEGRGLRRVSAASDCAGRVAKVSFPELELELELSLSSILICCHVVIPEHYINVVSHRGGITANYINYGRPSETLTTLASFKLS